MNVLYWKKKLYRQNNTCVVPTQRINYLSISGENTKFWSKVKI